VAGEDPDTPGYLGGQDGKGCPQFLIMGFSLLGRSGINPWTVLIPKYWFSKTSNTLSDAYSKSLSVRNTDWILSFAFLRLTLICFPLDLTCKRGSVSQSEGLLIPVVGTILSKTRELPSKTRELPSVVGMIPSKTRELKFPWICQ